MVPGRPTPRFNLRRRTHFGSLARQRSGTRFLPGTQLLAAWGRRGGAAAHSLAGEMDRTSLARRGSPVMKPLPFIRLAGTLLFSGWFLLSGGCAFHYYDVHTGTEHLWGFGHLRMKSPASDSGHAIVTGSRMLGISLRAGDDSYALGVGYDSHSRVTMSSNGMLALEWPVQASWPRTRDDLFTVRIGTNLPRHLNTDHAP
jgi:hypothetical protein